METILAQLISFDTTSTESNLPLIEFAKNIFSKAGFKIKLQKSENKANLFAFKETDKPRIILSAHTDTVPASENWKNSPFKLTKKNGQYFGLGVCDMKIFIAIMLEMAEKFATREDLAFLLTFNEELDFAGAKLINNQMIKRDDIIIIGEPTNNQAILAHKGVVAYKITFTGHGGHGSESKKELSAIEQASQFIQHYRDDFSEFAQNNQDQNFSNPKPTLNFGLINGGEAPNKIAEKCELILEMRLPNMIVAKKIDVMIKKGAADSKLKTNIDCFFTFPSFKASNTMKQLAKRNNIPIRKGASYATEAGIFNKLPRGRADGVFLTDKFVSKGLSSPQHATGYSAPGNKFTNNIMIFGPGGIEQAHSANESIEIKNIEIYLEKLNKLISSY